MTSTDYDLGMAGHSRAQEAMEITLEDLDNQEFDTNEIMITVIGKRATQCSWHDISSNSEQNDWTSRGRGG